MKKSAPIVRRLISVSGVMLFASFALFAQSINNQTTQQANANFNIDGTGKAGTFDAGTYTIGGNLVLTIGTASIFAGNGGRNSFPGLGNAFLGWDAGLANTGGSGNVFAGWRAGVVNRNGRSNTFVGSNTGTFNIDGESNSFFGAQAGLSYTASDNTFLGANAGNNNRTTTNNIGARNLFAGSQSGVNNTSGNNNSFLGFNAGGASVTGNNNTAVGAEANIDSANLAFASAIGSRASVGNSNTIVIGKVAGTYDGVARPADTVIIRGPLRLSGVGIGLNVHLCHNIGRVVNCVSSLRYKTNVSTFSSGLSLINKLRPIRFEWKEGGVRDVGLGAEDVAAIEPLLVTYNDQGEVEGVKYDQVTTVLVNAVKEQQSQIEAQQKQLKQQQLVIDGLTKFVCEKDPEAEVCRQ